MGVDITLKAADGNSIGGYHAKPEGKARGGVVVVQEIFGVNAHIREVCDLYAKLGYEAVAPAFFDRVQKDVNLGYTPADIDIGRGLMTKMDWDKVVLDVNAAIAVLKPAGKTGIVGYCWGGTVAWVAACRSEGLSAASCYYGGGVLNFVAEKPKCPVIMHFGDKDKGIPVENVEKIKAALPGVPVYRYAEADHGFSCDHRATFNAKSALLAMARTTEFFVKNIG